jgi:hypothetical protein
LARQVLSGQYALRQRRPHDLADTQLLTRRDDLGLDHPPQHRVLRLARYQLDLQVLGQLVGGPDLFGCPFGYADVMGLAGVHDIGQRLHRLLQRRRHVVAVQLVEVDVIDLQPAQRTVDRLHDVFT